MQELRSGEVLDLCLSTGIVVFIYVVLGIILDQFTGTATFSYAVLGIRMCISPGTAIFNYSGLGIRKRPPGEAYYPCDSDG